jgi:hypothetical protein
MTTASNIVAEIIGDKALNDLTQMFSTYTPGDDDFTMDDILRFLKMNAYAVHDSWVRAGKLPCKQYVIFALSGDMSLLLTDEEMPNADQYAKEMNDE